MRIIIAMVLLLALRTAYPTMGYIEKLDAELDQVLNTRSIPQVIGDGYIWAEGPVWVEEHSFLLFSDVPANRIYKWTETDGISVYLEPSGLTGEVERGGEIGSNGLDIGLDGKLLLSQHGDRAISRMEAAPASPAAVFSVLSSHFDGKKLNSPNDLVQHSNGDIYFTDPPYGLEEGVNDPARELDFQGVYRIDSSGETTLLTGELSRPNGLAFSPDEKVLYVANSDPDRAIWMAYDVRDDGTIANGRVFYDVTAVAAQERGLPDGMKVDDSGYLYATGPGGIWIFAPDARVLGRIKNDGEFTSNCAFGNNGTMLYMTVDSYLLRLSLN
ncbi:MAG: SMP-30/gluconolactonase/LRE family protein [Balneolales bacterium]